MFPASRINFGKMYTVEHNVKVYDFGDVRRSSLSMLVKQWRYVFDNNLHGNAPKIRPAEDEEEDSEQEDDYDDGDGMKATVETEEELPLPAKGIALWPWSANDNGQLEFRAGDSIVITEWADENWGRGKNLRTDKSGVFARNYVSMNDA